jgi:hypothetical protein
LLSEQKRHKLSVEYFDEHNMDPASVIASITAPIGFAKELVAVDKAVDQAEWKLKLADLTSALADAKIGVAELKGEIEAKNGEIAKLKKAFEFQGQTIKIGDMNYEAQDGKPVGMPFCPRCIAADGFYIKLTRLSQTNSPAQCPQCKSMFGRQT